MVNVFEEVVRLKQRREEGILITVIEKKGHGPAITGKKLIYLQNGEIKGTIGGGELEYAAVNKAKRLLLDRANCLENYDFWDDDRGEPSMICGGSVTLFFEYIPITPSIYIIGSGHVGSALAKNLLRLDCDVTIIDNRDFLMKGLSDLHKLKIGDYKEILQTEEIPDSSYFVIAANSHEIDYDVLKILYEKNCNPAYIGLLASRKKTRIIIQKLLKTFQKQLDLSTLYAPVGLNLGGGSPEEIAVSIVAEIQALKHGRSKNSHLSENWERYKETFLLKKRGDGPTVFYSNQI